MKIIIFTPEYTVPKEAQIIALLLENGVDRIHIRKTNKEEAVLLLKEIPKLFHHQISVHQHLGLLNDFPEIGFHISQKHKNLITDYWKKYLKSNSRIISTGIHKWNETLSNYSFDYQFISPVFDSISKKGYIKNSDLNILPLEYLDLPIYALGGVSKTNILEVKQIGYKGVGLLGCIWLSNDPLKTFLEIKEKIKCQD